MLNCLIAAGITAACFLYYYEILLPEGKKQTPQARPWLREGWINFIHANINQSFAKIHCHQCHKLILLFAAKFRKETPPHIFNNIMESLYNSLDTKYKTLLTEDERFGNMSCEDAIRIVQ